MRILSVIGLVCLTCGVLAQAARLEEGDANLKRGEVPKSLEDLVQLKPVPPPPLPPGCYVLFNSPGIRANNEEQVAKLIGQAKSEILFVQSAITSQRIADALTAAKRRGVQVIGILERKPNIKNYNSPDYLILNNILVFFDTSEGINASNYTILDRKIVITGSYQWTRASNTIDANDMLVLQDYGFVAAYYNQFLRHLNKCEIPPLLQERTAAIVNTIKEALSTQPTKPTPTQPK
jgi:phosphatidylserine/phosphatidylglycerophosphate/cardiolipin synthase-like enzyme